MTTPTPTCPPSVPAQTLDSLVESWRATAEATIDYWSGAFARGATPLTVLGDLGRWHAALADRHRPGWATPHELVFETPVARLRDFSDRSCTDAVVPTLVLPPQAGHDSCIVDYSGRQSQMQVIRAAGLRRLYSLDWVGATQETKDSSIEDYLQATADAVKAMGGGPVNLVGDCQGGWLATIYAALHPEQVNTLTIAGAPIDFHAGGAVIHGYVDLLGQGAPGSSRGGDGMAFYRQVVELGDGVMKGEFMLNGFVLIRPESEIAKQLGLLAHIHEPEHVERYRAFEDWFSHTQDIPGAFYLWIVEHLFRENRLVAGTLEIGGERVDLGRIDCPLYLLGGADDHITPPEQVFALADHASTPAKQVTRRTTSGGHLGLFMGSEALREHWPPLMAEVARRSRPRRRRAPAQRRARAKAQTPGTPRSIPAP